MRYQRHRDITERLSAGRSVSVDALAAELGVSRSTVRRDLTDLEQTGLVQRVHGGAVLVVDQVEVDRPFDDVADDDAELKLAVARRAADLVHDGDTVILDIGTTTRLLARCLRGRSVTVVTPSLAVLDELRDDPAVEVILLGGLVRRRYHSLVGTLTVAWIGQIHARTVFLSASGVSPAGDVLDTTMVELPTKRALLDSADTVVLLADRNKFPGKGSLRACGADRLDVIVTNQGADPESLANCEKQGARVVQI